jgi:hypothetical protein
VRYFTDNFDPQDYEGIASLSGNDGVTLMLHRDTKRQIVRKRIGGASRELYRQLVQTRHENLVRVYGLEDAGDYCYTYEEYIDGVTLDDIPKPIPVEQARDWIGQLCSAVKILHAQRPVIIHRDIKPGNVMLTKDGTIKLIDFDASKVFSSDKRRDTELMGTPDYAAPEQYGFAPSGPRTDIYAIGVLFHELVADYKPNEGNDPYKGRYKHIIQGCIELDPERRYKSVAELERQLGLRGVRRLIGIIPGFRTGVWWKKTIAIVFYSLAVVGAVSTIYDDRTLSFLGSLVTLFVPPYLLITNPLRFRENLPLVKSNSVPVKIVGVVLYILIWLILFTTAVTIDQI